jgi:hypothetical protein
LLGLAASHVLVGPTILEFSGERSTVERIGSGGCNGPLSKPAHYSKARDNDSQDSGNLDIGRLVRLERHLDQRGLLAPQFETEPVPVQGGTHDLEMTNVVLVMSLKVTEATVDILELPLDEHVGTITVVRGLEMHLIVVTIFRRGHVIKLDLHALSSRQRRGVNLRREAPSGSTQGWTVPPRHS